MSRITVAEIGVGQAAERLGVTPQRVRQLIGLGALEARSIGGRYVLDTDVIAGLGSDRPPGRPLSPRTAWSLVSMVEAGEAPDLSAAERTRLRARLRTEPSVDDVARWCRRRSRTHLLRGHRSVVRQALEWPGAVATGASARSHDLVDLRQVELYLKAEALEPFERKLHFEPAPKADANVVVHVPAIASWPFQGTEAGPVIVALDLFDAGAVRSKRAAVRLWERELAERRFEQRAH